MIDVNVISETSWILGRCAKELEASLGWSVNSREPARVDYHVPYWRGLDQERNPEARVGFFTHGLDHARRLADRFDAAVCMNLQMLNAVTVENGIGCKRSGVVIRPGVEARSRMPVFGVVGRTYRDGRKGEDLVAKAVDAGHEVISLGPGPWPCRPHSRDVNVPATRRFFRDIDYLLVTSLDEGGPMPVLEAIAERVPIIAPDVGWCWELPVIRYERGSWESLERVLRGLTVTPTWEEWAEQHREFFDQLLREAA